MRRWYAGVIGLLVPCGAPAQPPVSHPPGSPPPAPLALHASYQTYADGVPVAETGIGLSFDVRAYRIDLVYHTTGMVGLFFPGHQFYQVAGAWRGAEAEPARFVAEGEWRGVDRSTEIDYQQGKPVVRKLVPADEEERESVPESLQEHTIDTLSALATLIHVVAQTGRCEASVHTFDGRRAVEIEAHTGGEERLESGSRTVFAGKALRCDLTSRMLAGFRSGDDRERDARPMHGSAWLARVVAGGPPLPVQVTFETRWFGDATLYLTGTGPGADIKLAGGN